MHHLIHRLGRLLLVLGLLASGCGDDVTTSGFDADPAPIDPDLEAALLDGEDPAAVPEVQRNFLTGCVKGFDETIPALEPVQRAGLLQVCGCTYTSLVSHSQELVRDQVNQDVTPDDPDGFFDARNDAAFDAFTEIEDDLRAGEALTDDVAELVRTCIRQRSGL